MNDKTYMFQYYRDRIRDRIVEDTGLITLDEAQALYDRHILDFYEAVSSGATAEITIWKNCINDSHYSETLIYYDSDNCVIDDGALIEVVKIPVKMRLSWDKDADDHEE